MAQRLKTDRILLITVIFMVLFGSLMVYSASSVVAESRWGRVITLRSGKLIWVVIAIPLMVFFKNLHYRKLQTPAVAFTAMAVIMMLLVVVYFVGNQHRWLASSYRRIAAIGIRQARADRLPRVLHRVAVRTP